MGAYCFSVLVEKMDGHMIRVLRIINRLNLGGPTHNVAYLTKHLPAGFQTLLVAGSSDESEESSEFIVKDLGLDVVVIPEMMREINIRHDLHAYRKLRKLIADFKPDIVHTHAAKAGAVGRLAAFHQGVPVIVHTFHGHVFHSYFSGFKTQAFIKIERYLAGKTTAIIALSEKQKEELAGRYRICDPEKIEIIPLGFDLERFRQDSGIKRKVFREKYSLKETDIAVGIIGRLVPVKNHHLFIKAFKEAASRTSKSIKAFIIGDGELSDDLKGLCRTEGLSYTSGPPYNSSVIFTSWIKNIDEAYAGLDIVALSSLNEGTPVSLIEAQAAGKPVLTTDVGGIMNIVQPGITTLIAGDTVNDFSDKLYQLAENDSLRNRMSIRDNETIFTRFHYSRLVEETASLYRRLLRQVRP
jgi:glycosyltransferase involved in cell wall biosynthesis